MRNIQKPLGMLVFSALLVAGSILVVEGKTKKVFAQQEVSTTPTTINLKPTKWDMLEFLGRGELPKGLVINETYTQEELNGLIEGLLASKNISWFIDNASVNFTDDGRIGFSGRMLRPIKGNLVADATISIEDGKPVINIHSASYGIFRVPVSFVERVGNFVLKKKAMTEWMEVKNAVWKDFSVSNGMVHIYVVGK